IHSLSIGAEACRHESILKVSVALEGLAKRFLENPANLSVSTLQSAAVAVNLIRDLSAADPDLDHEISARIRVLGVDDDPIARRFMSNALQLKFLQPQSAADGKTALELATAEPYDV